jgi:regulator of sirC expression with transglutaminase-like and TPR domain
LLLAVEPTAVSELRDRGLLAYHLDDFPAALRDLEDYCRLRTGRDDPDQEELEQILDHVKTLRRRIGTMN